MGGNNVGEFSYPHSLIDPCRWLLFLPSTPPYPSEPTNPIPLISRKWVFFKIVIKYKSASADEKMVWSGGDGGSGAGWVGVGGKIIIISN